MKPIMANIGIEKAYKRQLVKLVTSMSLDVKKAVERAYSANMAQDSFAMDISKIIAKRIKEWQAKFDKLSKIVAKKFIGDVDSYSKRAMKQALREAMPVIRYRDIETPLMKNARDSFVAENVSLIKSIPSQYHTGVETVVQESIQRGRDLHYLTKQLQKRYDITKKRAILIARDQNDKATETLNRVRYMELGVKKARWLHTGGSKEPRKSHQHASGKVFELKKGCKIDGEYIQPGQLINCRCTCVPIFEDLK